ncbi:MAG: IS1634 family transposase [Candidatus Heimdallarchaeota archaeon]
MFLREKRINKNGTIYTYLNLVESVREKRKIKQKVLLNFGNISNWPPERLKKLSEEIAIYAGETAARLTEDNIDPEIALNNGPFLLADLIWQRLKLSEFFKKVLLKRSIEFEVEMAIKIMVFNRLTSPKSKLSLDEWSDEQYIPGVDIDKVRVHHYYRALDIVEESKDQFERWVYHNITHLFNFNLSLVFYDLTSSYFEGDGPEPLARFGYSRDHRSDCKQIQIGLLVNSEGIPISHIVFNGAVNDLKTLPDIISEMTSKFHIRECIFVADDGILNISTLERVKRAGYQFICSTSIHKENFAKELIREIPPFDE